MQNISDSSMPLKDTSRLCIHTITTRPWSIEEAVAAYASAEVKGITVWRQALKGRRPLRVGERIRGAGLSIVSLCRGGFFPALNTSGREAAIKDNLEAIDQAAELGAPLLVLVCGALPDISLESSRNQIRDGIAAVLPHAEACGVKLGVEPLHPMYADTRSAINTLRQANDLCDDIDSPSLGVVVDVYHLWWDPDLRAEIRRSGRAGDLFAFHICDWKIPTEDLLFDRGLMGEGCIPISRIRKWVEATDFKGFHEVEIFSHRHWAKDPADFLKEIVTAYLKYG
jgi:sugar phosphate isomerase/epimerase